jgi:hypothetical protein
VRQGFEDLRYDVLGSNPVDVVAPVRLQLQHHPGQLFRFYFNTGLLLTNLVILAEDTAQVAPGEETSCRFQTFFSFR